MSNYSIYERAKAEIEQRRIDAIQTADLRSEMLRTQSEEIDRIDAELSKTGLLIFKTACEGGDIAAVRARNNALQQRRKEIILSLGYPEDYTDVHYSCTDCNDTGYIGGTKLCHCLKEIIVRERIAESAMGKLIERQSFDNFDLEWYSNDEALYTRMKANFQAAKRFAEEFPQRGGNMLIVGGTSLVVYPAAGSSNSGIGLTIPELEEHSRCAAWVDVCKDWQSE